MIFDDFDIYYLANTLATTQLRREARQAELKGGVDNYFNGTPYADESPFPWSDYDKACREALRTIEKHNKRYPKPAAPGKHLDIAGIKALNDIITVIEGYTQLRKSGHNRFNGRCPLHEDKHPSLTVYADKQSWHCFQCNRGGDVFDFIMAVNTCDFRRAVEILGGT